MKWRIAQLYIRASFEIVQKCPRSHPNGENYWPNLVTLQNGQTDPCMKIERGEKQKIDFGYPRQQDPILRIYNFNVSVACSRLERLLKVDEYIFVFKTHQATPGVIKF
jgi:hypothetical protein